MRIHTPIHTHTLVLGCDLTILSNKLDTLVTAKGEGALCFLVTILELWVEGPKILVNCIYRGLLEWS